MAEPTGNAEPRVCTGTTQDGSLCRVPPLARGDRCVHHAELPRTAAQQEASRRNARKHTFFAATLEDVDKAEFADAREAMEDPLEVQKELAAYALFRARRMALWESEHAPSPLTSLALDRAQKAAQAAARPEEGQGFDREELGRIVETMAKDPEIFLTRMPLAVAAEVRAVLQKAKVNHGPA